LKTKVDAMARSALEIVDHEPVSRLDEDHPSTVCHGIRQPSIAIVIGVREIQGRRRDPAAQTSARSIPPGEWSSRNRLRLAVDDDRTVRLSAAKKVSPDGIGCVAVHPGIDETALTECRELHAE
jgi:hypothetical protein